MIHVLAFYLFAVLTIASGAITILARNPVHSVLSLILAFFFFVFSWVKATVPRFRYDQLMRIGWKLFLPLSLLMVVIVAFVLQLTGWGWHGGIA